ncbi:MAG: hypothetical protein AB1641_09585 [Thermodesulfobacteriota bacterium]
MTEKKESAAPAVIAIAPPGFAVAGQVVFPLPNGPSSQDGMPLPAISFLFRPKEKVSRGLGDAMRRRGRRLEGPD